MRSVLPSGAAAFTAMLATMPPAPGLFSTTTDRPSDTRILSAISRVTVSLLAPGGKPSTMRNGASSAQVGPARDAPINKVAPVTAARRVNDFTVPPFFAKLAGNEQIEITNAARAAATSQPADARGGVGGYS